MYFYIFTEPYLPNFPKFPWGENRLFAEKLSSYSGIHSNKNGADDDTMMVMMAALQWCSLTGRLSLKKHFIYFPDASQQPCP